MEDATEGPRARYRRQVREEVQARAWEQMKSDGASALSLKAIATQMGMTAPALYRYYRSRDELLTELILGAYTELAGVVEAAAEGTGTGPDVVTDIAAALREWALAHPQRYLLLYGTPVPGYHAPADATALAQRIFNPILGGFAPDVPRARPEAGDPAFEPSLRFWTRLHGVLSLELAGHFAGMDFDPAQHFENEVRSLLD